MPGFYSADVCNLFQFYVCTHTEAKSMQVATVEAFFCITKFYIDNLTKIYLLQK